MSDKSHEWLDGEIPFAALSSAEAAEARRMARAIREAAAAAEEPSPGLADAVMAALPQTPRAAHESVFTRLVAALWVPSGALRPAAAAAAFSLVVGFGLGLWAASPRPADPGVATASDTLRTDAAEPRIFVRFDVRIPDARTVELAGSFSGWEPRHELTRSAEGHWTVTIPIEPGVHDYVFIVDGTRQVLDPAAPRIADGFGSYNNRIALLASST